MKYYLILLLYGKVVEINSYDTEEARDAYAKFYKDRMREWSKYDEVQTLNEVV